MSEVLKEVEEVVNVLRENGFIISSDDVVLMQRARNGGEVLFVYITKGGVVLRLSIAELDGSRKVLGPEFILPKPQTPR